MLKIAFNCNWCFFFRLLSYSCAFIFTLLLWEWHKIKCLSFNVKWVYIAILTSHPIPDQSTVKGKKIHKTWFARVLMENFDSAFTNLPFIYNVHMDLMVCGWCRYTLQKKSIDNLKQWYVQDQSPENKTYAERVTGIYVLWVEFESMPLFRSHF